MHCRSIDLGVLTTSISHIHEKTNLKRSIGHPSAVADLKRYVFGPIFHCSLEKQVGSVLDLSWWSITVGVATPTLFFIIQAVKCGVLPCIGMGNFFLCTCVYVLVSLDMQ
jgi:hypothetical protein